jgi:hypothetical protein
MDEAQQAELAKAYRNFTAAGGTLFIDGKVPESTAAMLAGISGFDEIDVVGFLGDLKTFTMMMEANALGNQAGATKDSKAILRLTGSDYMHMVVTWTK